MRDQNKILSFPQLITHKLKGTVDLILSDIPFTSSYLSSMLSQGLQGTVVSWQYPL